MMVICPNWEICKIHGILCNHNKLHEKREPCDNSCERCGNFGMGRYAEGCAAEEDIGVKIDDGLFVME